MQKIPTIFVRDWEGDPSRVTHEPTPGCEWVFAGEGTATRKYDGTCTMRDEDGKWWARRDVRKGKPVPEGFMPTGEPDPKTGKTAGWEPIEQSPFAKFHAEALQSVGEFMPGTYELLGPKVQKNPERSQVHVLVAHGADVLSLDGRSFDDILTFLAANDIEGIVFHHSDGRMAKIKKRDFGLSR